MISGPAPAGDDYWPDPPKTILMIDDVRSIPSSVVADVKMVVRTYDQGVSALEDKEWDLLYLDHDLGDFDEEGREWTGYDIMIWLGENKDRLPKAISCVSANPVGVRNIEAAIKELYKNADPSNE
jgi:hypothetical protein